MKVRLPVSGCRVWKDLPFSNFCLLVKLFTKAGTGVGLLLGFFAEIDPNGQCRVHDTSVWLA